MLSSRKRSTLPILVSTIAFFLVEGKCLSEPPALKSWSTRLPFLSEADQAFQKGEYYEAVRLYSKAHGHSPALLGRGMAYEMLGKLDKAVEDYKKAIQLDPNNYQAMESLAGIYQFDEKRTAEAITLYKQALELDPRKEAREHISICLAILENRLRPKTAYAVGCWNYGNEKALEGNYEEAQALYTEALKFNPDMFQAYFNRGLIRMKLGDVVGAVSDFAETTRICPSFRGGFVQEGLAYEILDEPEKALKAFDQAVRYDSQNPEALFHFARFLEKNANFKEALEMYKKASELHPKQELNKLIEERITAIRSRQAIDSKR